MQVEANRANGYAVFILIGNYVTRYYLTTSLTLQHGFSVSDVSD